MNCGNSYQAINVIELLRIHAQAKPNATLFTFLSNGEGKVSKLTYGELDRRAQGAAVYLKTQGVPAKTPVLLLFEPGLDYICAFFGCLYADILPVPAYPPIHARQFGRLQAIIEDAHTGFAFTTHSGLQRIKTFNHPSSELSINHWLLLDDAPLSSSTWQDPGVGSTDIAFLQYTSGSTSTPKGVMVSHGNLIDNTTLIGRIAHACCEDVCVYWLPPFHDFGLIGAILFSLAMGASCVLMRPITFLLNPYRWLKAISDYRGTITGAPNFAFDLCTRRITQEQKATLDLSHLRCVLNGAEPIRWETLRAFTDAFQHCGFRADKWLPCYGLAESTLMASGILHTDPLAQPFYLSLSKSALTENRIASTEAKDDVQKIVGVGSSPSEHQIIIADPKTRQRCDNDQIGEIWFKGPSVTQGYWRRPEQTAATFNAHLADCGSGPYLRTGDLGFLHKNTLYVTGRLKDLIILRGQNLYPQDIELTVEKSHPQLRPDAGAAFTVNVAGEERLVVVQELQFRSRPQEDEVITAIRQAVFETFDLADLYAIVLIKAGSIPKTSSGKIQRRACREQFLNNDLKKVCEWQQSPVSEYVAPGNDIERRLASFLCTALGLDRVGIHDNFFELGGTSQLLVRLQQDLARQFSGKPSIVDLFKYPTIEKLAHFLAETDPDNSLSRLISQRQACRRQTGDNDESGNAHAIAIVGMSGRFPGADTLDEFWENLAQGRDSITSFTTEQLLKAGVDRSLLDNPQYVKAAALLTDIDLFDFDFFGFLPRDAAITDPQHRIFLECAWEALEDAGFDPQTAPGQTGVYAGVSNSTYLIKNVLPALPDSTEDLSVIIGNDKDYIATRLSYKLNLHGPSMAVQTACSTSLVSVHLACQGLLAGECGIALAGGASIRNLGPQGYLYTQGSIFSPDGRCRPFDARANGMIFGDGAGVVVLKRLDRALADGNRIHALIKGSAINNDGSDKVGYTAPSVNGQAAVIAEAQAVANIAADTISYVETHGTATALGDPIEIEALTQAFRLSTDKRQFCAIGALKGNIGHLDSAAGIAALIKTVLALKHRTIPPNPHFSQANPRINFSESPFFVNTGLTEWHVENKPRRAGISAFGFGGTNAHVILEEAPALPPSDPSHGQQLILLSARTPSALDTITTRFFDFLRQNPEVNLADVAYTLQIGRHHFPCRRFFIYPDRETVLADPTSDSAPASFLNAVGEQWLNGAEIDWHALYRQERRQLVNLPTYPFERKRCWIEPPKQAAQTDIPRAAEPLQQPLIKRSDISQWFYAPSWQRSTAVTHLYQPSAEFGSCLFFYDRYGISQPLVEALKRSQADLTIVKSGPAFKQEASDVYIIDSADPEGYGRLLGELSARRKIPTKVVHGWSLTPGRAPGNISQEDCFHSLLFFSQALNQLEPASSTELYILSNGVHCVTGDEILFPQKATLLGPCQVISRHYSHIRCRHIDIVVDQDKPLSPMLTELLLSDIGSNLQQTTKAYRGRHLWEPVFKPVQLIRHDQPFSLRLKGRYLITGGLGGIGLAFAHYLASRGLHPQIFLCGRSHLPARETWNAYLTTHPETDATSVKIRALLSLEASGAEISYLRVDISREQDVFELARTINADTHPLHGIFHAAGIYPTQLQNTTSPTVQDIFAPKLKGTQLLDKVFNSANLDFFLLCSSLSSINPAINEMSYSAANAFLDAFAQAKQLSGCRQVMAIDWDIWQDVGMAAKMGLSSQVLDRLSQRISVKDAPEIFDFLLANALPQVIVSPIELQALMANTGTQMPSAPPVPGATPDLIPLPGCRQTRPPLTTPYIAPRNTLEHQVAEIWQELFGIDGIGIDDNFFDLGGHSLLATQLVSRLRQLLNVELPLEILFECPSIATVAQRISQADTGAAINSNSNTDNKGIIEPHQTRTLSFAQESMLFLQQLEAGNPFYNECIGLRIEGHLDTQAFERAVNELARRHEVLRTTYSEVDGKPAPVLIPASNIPVSVTDLSELPPTAREGQAMAILNTEALRPFDLARDPLIRVNLIQLGSGHHIVHFTLHHMVSDGASLEVLITEITTLYRAYSKGLPPPLKELPIQYTDFAHWQRQWLQGERLEQLLSYWQKQLDSIPDLLHLPTNRPRPQTQSYRGATIPLTLSEEVSQGLYTLAKASNSTLFMVLATAVNILLSRYSGQKDICIGTPSANRDRAEVHPLIGFFINLLVLRTRLDNRPRFRQLLEQVRETAVQAYAHRDLPFELLVKALNPERSLSYSPLFQVMVAPQNAPTDKVDIDGLSFEPFAPENQFARFDLTFDIWERREITVLIEYSTDLFDRSTIERMASHFTTLCAAIVANPDALIDELPLLAPAERTQILCDWNATDRDYPTTQTLPMLFETQVEKTPGAIACLYNGASLTYAELNHRANQLAHDLRQRGVGPDTLVGLCVERSLEMVVGLLAILKAGGAYLPLDPGYPSKRLETIVQEAAPAMLLIQERLRAIWTQEPSPLFCLDSEWELLSACPRHNPPPLLHPSHLAYVIYTSGSTGKPKGVGIDHAGIVNRLQWMQEAYALNAQDRVLQKTPFSFDVSVWEFFWPLLTGATLVLAKPGGHQDPLYLAQLIHQAKVTTLHFVPPLLDVFLTATGAQGCDGLRQVICSGEALPWELTQRFFQVLPQVALHNLYGPTEASVDVSAWSCSTQSTLAKVPIGCPVANTSLYVLDERLQPVPAGVPGELYIGGRQLARGYIKRPDLTAERFLPNPFQAGARLYKTGDLVRYLPDGTIEYLGRIDQQVKIRGFRIEPGEIETALLALPEVREACVIAREDRPGVKQLVAYLVAQAEQTPPPADQLREHLSRSLPEYMLPAHFMLLDKLPLNANGKFDRQALPAPEHDCQAIAHIAPRTPLETTLAGIWAQVLGLERVGMKDNFFHIGGDSILAIQIVARARQAKLQLTPRDIFRYPTLEQLALVVQTGTPVDAGQGLVTGGIALLPVQQWFFERKLPAPHHFNQSLFFRVNRKLDSSALAAALAALIHHHDALRSGFSKNEETSGEIPEWTGSIHAHYDQSHLLLCRDLSSLDKTRQQEALAHEGEQWQGSMDLEQGPLFKAAYFTLNEQEGRLLFCAHHLVIDGVSWRILLEDFATAYTLSVAGQNIILPAKTSSFKAWGERLTDYAHSETLAREIPFWTRVVQSLHTLPADFSKDRPAMGDIATLTLSLTQEETSSLLRETAAAYRTQINDLLLTALALAWQNWTGQSAVTLELEGHGREELFDDIDLSRTVGWFTSIYPVALCVAGGDDYGASIKTIKEQLRAIPNKGIGYGILRYLTKTPALLETAPVPILFNYLSQAERATDPSAWLSLSREAHGNTCAAENPASHLLAINAIVGNGQLRIDIHFSAEHFHQETIEGFAEHYLTHLRGIIRHCANRVLGYTPSDFPLAHLSQPWLDRLFEQQFQQQFQQQEAQSEQIEDIYPLTPMQQGLLFHSLMVPGSGIYVEQLHLTFDAGLDITAFTQALQYLVDRHSILRTAISREGLDTPVQRVYRHRRVNIPMLDWRSSPAAEQQQLDTFLAADRRTDFDLAQAPLLRMTLIRLDDSTCAFVWSHHHLLCDGWSFSLLMRELLDSYRAFEQGLSPDLPPVRPYSDYIAWLSRQDSVRANDYWRQALAGFEAPTPLMIDGHYPQHSGYAEHHWQLDDTCHQALTELARTRGFTLNTLVQAVWAILLHRYSQHNDLLFGITVSGRTPELPDIESMVGLFINTLPLRVHLDPRHKVLDWLGQLQAQNLDLRQYEHSSLTDIQSLSAIPQGTPLFESLVVFENYPIAASVESARQALPVRQVVMHERTHYPLTIVAAAQPVLKVSFGFDPARFDRAAIQRLSQHFQTLCESIVAHPEAQIRELELLRPEERKQILFDWNATQAQYPGPRTIHQLFEQQVRKTPRATAVVFEGQQLSYAELNERANQLAHYLRECGIGPDVLVGLCVERCVEMIVALLAILKAGGAYLPLDPGYPKDRLAFMLQDAQPAMLLSQECFIRTLPYAGHCFCFDRDSEQLTRFSKTNPLPRTLPEHLAYVIYTSGSTGIPKGVLLHHSGLCHFIQGQAHAFGVGPEERVLQYASFNFDGAVFEIFLALTNGARLYLAPPQLPPGDPLLDYVQRHEITTFALPPAALAISQARRLPQLKNIIVAGDVCPPALVKQWAGHYHLYNGYGPTETTIGASHHLCSPDTTGNPPIGRPVANAQIYILNNVLEPVPIGVPGEMYISGRGMARGFLNRSELTAEKFIPNPFGSPGLRMYRTGDLARFLADGNIEYLGRIDLQIKIRGFRIDPGEIEVALTRLPGALEACVIAHGESPDEKHLIAYIVWDDAKAQMTSAGLRAALSQSLPEHMLPTHFIYLRRLPLTPAGKLDRKALPLPDTSQPGFDYIAPKTETEKTLASIWAQVLKREPIGLYDNFFALGGHSLLATQLTARVNDTFAGSLPLASIFSSPTLIDQAKVIDKAMETQAPLSDRMIPDILDELFSLSEEEVDRLATSDVQKED